MFLFSSAIFIVLMSNTLKEVMAAHNTVQSLARNNYHSKDCHSLTAYEDANCFLLLF